MFALLCWEICKTGEGLDGTEPCIYIIMLAVARARVQANVIVLINRDTASVLWGLAHARPNNAIDVVPNGLRH